MKDYKALLSQAIFEKWFDQLGGIEKEFVLLHYREFRNYKKIVAQKFREVLGKKKLDNRDYEKIFQYYCKRIPLWAIQQGMKKATQLSQRYNQPIHAAGYFHKHVMDCSAECIRRVQKYIEGRIDEPEPDYPWLFDLFRRFKEGGFKNEGLKFDAWQGYRLIRNYRPQLIMLDDSEVTDDNRDGFDRDRLIRLHRDKRNISVDLYTLKKKKNLTRWERKRIKNLRTQLDKIEAELREIPGGL